LKSHLENLFGRAVESLPDADAAAALPVEVERTRDSQHGHFATNIAMRLAKPLRRPPRDIAQDIVDRLPDSEFVAEVNIAGPGFINCGLTPLAFSRELVQIIERGDTYGHSNIGAGQKVIAEYVSANPTGPLHVGHGRHAAYGATVSALLKATGHSVHREYYVNDAGRQMDILALSVWLRLLESQHTGISFPGSAYRGQYVRDIAEEARERLADSFFLLVPPNLFDDLPTNTDGDNGDLALDALIQRARDALGADGFQQLLDIALENILGDIRDDLDEFGVIFDKWFSERGLTDSGAIDRALQLLSDRGVTYERDGAVWFRATDYGDEKDRVVVRENGRTTYFASDIAYHLQKRERGFDALLDVLGADHHGYVARVRAGLEAMGQTPDCLEVRLVQFVVLYRGQEKVQMSTRSGEFVTLRELREEVGNDAARLFFVMRSNEQHLDFDLELAKSQSNENPIYYLQYAHARVCSVMRELESRGLSWDEHLARDHLDLLGEEQEESLMLALSRFPETVTAAALQRSPQHVVHYLRELAQDFHAYYNAHRFIVDDAGLRNARLMLVLATRQVMRNGLDLLGVGTPESM